MNDLPLKDIHLPDSGFWWPPAPGWWVLLGLIILAIYLLPQAWRWLRRKPIHSMSLVELNRVRKQQQENPDQRLALQQISGLLRRTVMSYRGRRGNANLSGQAWLARLNELAGRECFSQSQIEILAEGQYRRELEVNIDDLCGSCEHWIKSLPRRQFNVSD